MKKTFASVKLFDVVRLLKPVSGISEVEGKEVSFPAGTKGTILEGPLYAGHYLIEISWQPSPVSEDGLLIYRALEDFEVVRRSKKKPE